MPAPPASPPPCDTAFPESVLVTLSGEGLDGVAGVYSRRGSVESDGDSFPVYCRETPVGLLCVNAARMRVQDTLGNDLFLKLSLLRWQPGWSTATSYGSQFGSAFSLAVSMSDWGYGPTANQGFTSGWRNDCEAFLPSSQQWLTAASISLRAYSSLSIQYLGALAAGVETAMPSAALSNHTMGDLITASQLEGLGGVGAAAASISTLNISSVTPPTIS